MSVPVLDYIRGKSQRDIFRGVVPPDTPRTGNELTKVISVYFNENTVIFITHFKMPL